MAGIIFCLPGPHFQKAAGEGYAAKSKRGYTENSKTVKTAGQEKQQDRKISRSGKNSRTGK
jgi:hypothetical protein